MIELSTPSYPGAGFATATTTDGALFVHNSPRTCVLVLPSDLDRLLEDVRIAIALRDAE